jgi:hypothetical protein
MPRVCLVRTAKVFCLPVNCTPSRGTLSMHPLPYMGLSLRKDRTRKESGTWRSRTQSVRIPSTLRPLLSCSFKRCFTQWIRRKCLRYNLRMDNEAIISTLNVEIDRLQKARALLTGTTIKGKVQKPVKATSFAFGTNVKPRRKMSAEGRARIAAAQRARWAKTKR